MKKWLTIVVILALAAVVVGYSYASPYLTVSRVRRAALLGDSETVNAHVDFPALRESIRGSMGVAMAKQMAKTDMKDNPFAALGAGLAMMMAEKMVDLMITPEAVRAMLEGQRPQPQQSEKSSSPAARDDQKSEPVMGYEAFDRFTVTFHDSKRPHDEFTLVWRRSGFTWKLSSVRLPMPE